MHRVYDGYERRKALDGAARLRGHARARACGCSTSTRRPPSRSASRFAAFTVDEYQDVNPLQAGLLDRWLGDRDDLCVVGDDYQTIYAFTGASPSHLLGFTTRYPHATVVRLEENYRSTPEVLELANRLATAAWRVPQDARARPGPSGTAAARARPSRDEEAEVGASRRRRCGELRTDEDVPLEEIAVLYRINAHARSRFEEAFAAAAIPYQVRDGAFLRRPGPALGAAAAQAPPAARWPRPSTAITDQLGYDPEAAPDADEEVTRQSDLGRMRVAGRGVRAAHAGRRRGAFGAELARAGSRPSTAAAA